MIIKGVTFTAHDDAAIDAVLKEFELQDTVSVKRMLNAGFMPGDLLRVIAAPGAMRGKPVEFLSRILDLCRKQQQADPGEGFWSDHWSYNLDLILRYLSVYPDHLDALLMRKKAFSFYCNDAHVLPRSQRYVLTPAGVRQYHSVAESKGNDGAGTPVLRTKGGQGEVYHTTLLVKLLCLLANKAATLDPSGIGIEMEANKPNWYDALNGLPGLLGSSICETFELKRFAEFVSASIEQLGLPDTDKVVIFTELAEFIEGLTHILGLESDPLKYWHKANDLKEHYRQLIRSGIDGSEKHLTIAAIKNFLHGIISKVDRALDIAQSADGTFASYYYHEVIGHEVLDKAHSGSIFVKPLGFERHDLPLFLEGFVHALRVTNNAEHALALHQSVKKSKLYDRALGMYKVNADLSRETEEIGRARIFPKGWLENESIWLHMEYKYLLELLRNGLYKEFFQEAKSAFIPFLDPLQYGRSVLENSSFIVSSAHEDKNLHGQGFVARLSGSTAEFIHIWLLMNAGEKPFRLNAQRKLVLCFNPVLPAWLFTAKPADDFPAHTYAFKFLGSTLVVYHNPKRRDTFGSAGVKPSRITMVYADRRAPVVLNGAVIPNSYAQDVRDRKVLRIDITLG